MLQPSRQLRQCCCQRPLGAIKQLEGVEPELLEGCYHGSSPQHTMRAIAWLQLQLQALEVQVAELQV